MDWLYGFVAEFPAQAVCLIASYWKKDLIAGDLSLLASAFLAMPLWVQSVKIRPESDGEIDKEMQSGKVSAVVLLIVKLEWLFFIYSVVLFPFYLYLFKASASTLAATAALFSVFHCVATSGITESLVTRLVYQYTKFMLKGTRVTFRVLRSFGENKERPVFFIGMFLLLLSAVASRLAPGCH